jgi:hypothetical protein
MSTIFRTGVLEKIINTYSKYKVVQIWPGQTVTCLHTNSPGHIWTTLLIGRNPKEYKQIIQISMAVLMITVKIIVTSRDINIFLEEDTPGTLLDQ